MAGRWGGLTRTHARAYQSWMGMRRRCLNPADQAWANYGGRGISVCERWRDDFAAFVADMGNRPIGYTIERRDNDGPYSPDNCMWATARVQNVNKRNTRMVEYRGETLPLRVLCDAVGADYDLTRLRLNAGWSLEDALTVPRADNRPPVMDRGIREHRLDSIYEPPPTLGSIRIFTPGTWPPF